MSMFKPKTPSMPVTPPPPTPATAAGEADGTLSRSGALASMGQSLVSGSPGAALARKPTTAKTSLIGGA